MNHCANCTEIFELRETCFNCGMDAVEEMEFRYLTGECAAWDWDARYDDWSDDGEVPF